jgi:hypothetical protein
MTLAVAGVLLIFLNRQSPLDGFTPHLIVFSLTFPIIGWLIAKRLPGNRVGLILMAGSVSWATAFVANEYAWYVTFTQPASFPGAALSAWIGSWVWIPGTALFTTGLPLLFPDGRLVSDRWRSLLVFVGVGAAVATVAQAIALWPIGGATELLVGDANGSDTPGVIGFLDTIGTLMTFLAPLAATVSVFVRLRRARGVERLQMRWFAYAMAVLAVTMIADQPLPAIGALKPSVIGIVVLPAAIGIAIFRYRLYEIDRIISRTISWTLTTGVIVAVFAAFVVGLQGVLAQITAGNTVSVAASTLVVFAIFQPVRRRVQRAVDRRFNRSRYDAERTVGIFGERLRSHVDLAGLGLALATTADEAVHPTGVRVWIRSRGAG